MQDLITVCGTGVESVGNALSFKLCAVFVWRCGFHIYFSVIYMWFTPYNEMALIRAGHGAAALSFAGALIGFALTLAACAIYHTSFVAFMGWALAAMVVQLIGYVVTSRLIPNLKQHMLDNNLAVGGFVGTVALALGI